jgi:hypothetical protein
VNYGPRSYFLYIAITCLLYSHCLLYLHTTIAFHSICLFLCLQQTGEIDNLIVSWEQSIWLCCVQVLHCSWQNKTLDEAPYKLSGAIAKLVSITFLSLPFSWTDKPWFLTEGKAFCYAHHTFLLGFPTGRWFTSLTVPHHSPPWEGSSSPPGLWVCGGNFVQSLYVWLLLKSIWCALHYYGTIYVIPMVDIVLWDNIFYESTIVLRLYGLSNFGITPMIHAMNLSMHNAFSTMSWGAWHHQV